MPTLKHPPKSSVALEAPGLVRNTLKALDTHVHVALAVVAIFGAISLLIFHRRRSPSRVLTPPSGLQALDIKHNPTSHPLGYPNAFSHGKRDLAVRPVWAKGRHELDRGSGPGRGCQPSHEVCAAGFLPIGVLSGQHRHFFKPPTMEMDGNDGGMAEEHHYPGSAPATSRGVSTTDPRQHGPSPFSPSAVTITGRARRSPSTRASSRASSIRRQSGSSDGIDGRPSKGNGKGPMTGQSDQIGGFQSVALRGQAEPASALIFDEDQVYAQSAQKTAPFQFPGMDFAIPRQFSRPPPPPPLVPPTLSSSVFPFEDRCPSYAVSIHPELDTSFIHQPNPEYSGCSTSTDVLSSSPSSPTAIPRRRSYTKSVPIGIPVPTTTASASSSSETMVSRGTGNFFPSSYPPTSPLLPPPPPSHDDASPLIPPPPPPEYVFVGGPGGPGVFLSQQEINLQGEIISVMDGTGQGWKRHTRVYGGGSCLACVAARGRGEGQGGFYGDKVPLADRR